jgi:hypothetical protein
MSQQSGILTLENLQLEYDNTMILYQQAQENYNSALNNIDKKKYIAISGKTYWGTGAIKQKTGSSISECSALCSNDAKCKGATFDSKDNTCWTRSGSSSLTTGTSTQSAIISEVTNAALNLQNLNTKLLLDIDKMKTYKFDNGNTTPGEREILNTNVNTGNENLKVQYEILLADRKKIKEILDEFSRINMDNKNMEIYNTQNRSYYMIWCYLALVFIIIFVKMTFYPEMVVSWGSFFLYTMIGAILLLLVHFLKSVSVFFVFLLMIFSFGIILTLFS